MRFKIRMTSKRSGNVAWIRQDGTPSDYESEAGVFTADEADAVIGDYTATLVRVIGRFPHAFALIEVS